MKNNLEIRKSPEPKICPFLKACIHFKKESDLSFLEMFNRPGVKNVYYKYSKEGAKENGFLGGGEDYIISSVDYSDKFSKDFLDCTCIIAVGKDEDGDIISFMTHQNPERFLVQQNVQDQFKKDLIHSLKKLKNMCEEDTIDIIILGGNKDNLCGKSPIEPYSDYDLDRLSRPEIQEIFDNSFDSPYDKYVSSVKFLSNIIFRELGFHPEVAVGPNANFESKDGYTTDIYLNTQKGQVHVVIEPNTRFNLENFPADKINEQSNKFS